MLPMLVPAHQEKKNKKKGRREEEKGDAEGKAAAENQVKTIKKEINVTNK